MPIRLNHGGACCGINHYQNFTCSVEELLPQLAREVAYSRQYRTSLEVVLTQSQVRIYGRHLEGHGFKPVFKFRNGNSGKECTVYYYHPNPIPVEPCSNPILAGPNLIGKTVRITSTRCQNSGETAKITDVTTTGRYLLSTGQYLGRSSFEVTQ